ncbi:hypothetical protein F5X96DRAFT_678340 [Biscogniauxia mediterranea]|nr:hypothetical protein F5X96DRAFT_678340 [Biscogniauxia mediterranea]
MFLHSGASLHGHEYSKRLSPAVPNAAPRRNPLLRSSLTAPINRNSIHHPEAPKHDTPTPELKRPRPVSEYTPRPTETVVRFREPVAAKPERPTSMSEDEGSIVSDSDASKTSSTVRQRRRRVVRKSTNYVLAQPPPKLRNKQRILHIRPKLLLQLQQVSAGQRPRPAIDVYPSSVITGSIFMPLLKRFPRMALIKRELAAQDVILVKSEDYGAHVPESDSEGDEDNIKSRDMLAILSPLRSEDKAEIVLADGTVWVASPRPNGNYEFVSVDAHGITTIARWVRKQIVAKSLPTTPTMSTPPMAKIQPPDYKFTFSIIDPNCRRHPIMATLTNSSLEILDSYTTVSPSASRYPPTSTSLSSPSVTSDEKDTRERSTQPVEEWQKSFISISATWVALRHGWAPNSKPADVMSAITSCPTSPTDGSGMASRGRTFSIGPDAKLKLRGLDSSYRRKCLTDLQPQSQPVPDALPRRATSTGAAFIHKRRTMKRENSDQSEENDAERIKKLGRRAFSGDWHVGARKSEQEPSMSEMVESEPAAVASEGSGSGSSRTSALAPPPLPTGRRAVSAYYSYNQVGSEFCTPIVGEMNGITAHSYPTRNSSKGELDDGNSRNNRHQKLKSLGHWLRKLSGH